MTRCVLRTAITSVAFALTLPWALGRADPQSQLDILTIDTVTPTFEQFLTGDENHKPVAVAGELCVPASDPRYSTTTSSSAETARFPAVVLIHGSGGILPYHERWVRELNDLGIATFLIDSFSSRGITNTANDQSQLSSVAMMIDAYRALGKLAQDPRIDVNASPAWVSRRAQWRRCTQALSDFRECTLRRVFGLRRTLDSTHPVTTGFVMTIR